MVGGAVSRESGCVPLRGRGITQRRLCKYSVLNYCSYGFFFHVDCQCVSMLGVAVTKQSIYIFM